MENTYTKKGEYNVVLESFNHGFTSKVWLRTQDPTQPAPAPR
jgi:hypothetical protein